MVAGVQSSFLPPWLDTQTASTPDSSARGISLGLITPLSMIFKVVWSLSQRMSYQTTSLLTWWIKELAVS